VRTSGPNLQTKEDERKRKRRKGGLSGNRPPEKSKKGMKKRREPFFQAKGGGRGDLHECLLDEELNRGKGRRILRDEQNAKRPTKSKPKMGIITSALQAIKGGGRARVENQSKLSLKGV